MEFKLILRLIFPHRELDNLTRVQVHHIDPFEITYGARMLKELLESPHFVIVVLHETSQHRDQKTLKIPVNQFRKLEL